MKILDIADLSGLLVHSVRALALSSTEKTEIFSCPAEQTFYTDLRFARAIKFASPVLFYQTWIFTLNIGVTKPGQRGHGWSLPVGWRSRAGSDGSLAAPGPACSMLRLVEAPGVATPMPKPGRSRISIYYTEAWTVCPCQDFTSTFINNIKENLKLDSSMMWNVPRTTTDCAPFEFPFSFYFCKNGSWEKKWGFQ